MADEISSGFVTKIRNGLKGWFGKDSSPEPKKTSEYLPKERGGWWQIINDWYSKFINKGGSRQERYDRYSFLDDNLVEASTSLNLYADNIVSGAIGGLENFTVVVEEGGINLPLIKSIIEDTEKRTEIKDQIWEIARDLIEFGDTFEEIVVVETEPGKYGIQKLKQLPEKEMYVDESEHGVLTDPQYPYIQKRGIYDKDVVKFDWWRCIHFKLGRGTYGVNRALFANASQRIGRQLLWVDDSMILARLSRAWMRYAFNIDTTGLSPEEAWEHVQKYMDQVKRKEIIDKDTGRINVYDSPPLPDEDIGIPVREGSKQGVQVLTGDSNIGNIADVEYFQRKFFMAVAVPKAYCGLEEGVRSKATLGQIDVQFARQVRRKQAALIPGLRKFYEIAFFLNGIDPTSFVWDVVFPELNTIDELLAWEMAEMKAKAAKILMVDIGALNNQWLFREVMGFDEEQIEEYGLDPDEEEPPEENPFLQKDKDDNEDDEDDEDEKNAKEMMRKMGKELREKVKKSPYLRSILEDLKDIVAYKQERSKKLSGMKPVGLKRTDKLSDKWR